MNILEIVKKYQPVLTGGLVFLLLMQKCKNDTYIEDSEREYQHLKDSLNTVNTMLYKEIETKREQNDSLLSQNDSLTSRSETLDNSISKLEKIYVYETASIDYIGLDSNVILLSNFLSQNTNP